MSDGIDFASTRDNQNIALRPLNKGMVRNISAQMLPLGSFYDVQNLIVTENGPLKRPGFSLSGRLGSALATSDWPILDAFTFVNAGTNETLVITSTSVKKFDFINGFSSISGGDDIFSTDKINNIDWTIIQEDGANKVLFADGSGVLKVYDGTGVSTYDSTYTNPKVVEWSENRLFIGSPDDSKGNWLVWSEILDPDQLEETNYLIFSEEMDRILRLKDMGNLLICFFPKAIYFGRPTNAADLPYAFTKVPTGGIGLIGKKALTEYNDGLFFVGQDDVYFFSAENALQAVGSPVVKEMIKNCQFKEGIYCATDPVNDSLIVGVPGGSENIEELWYFNYKAGAWSHSPISCDMIATLGVYTGYKWTDDGSSPQTMTIDGNEIETWGGTNGFEDYGYRTWRSLEKSIAYRDLFIGADGMLYQSDDLANVDSGNGFISVILETGDIDLNLPDTDKTFNRLSMKIDRIAVQDILFDVFTSNDRGRNWTYRGAMRIDADSDETYVNFRAKGSTCRFRITSLSDSDPYIINEIIIRGRVRGLQTDGGGI